MSNIELLEGLKKEEINKFHFTCTADEDNFHFVIVRPGQRESILIYDQEIATIFFRTLCDKGNLVL